MFHTAYPANSLSSMDILESGPLLTTIQHMFSCPYTLQGNCQRGGKGQQNLPYMSIKFLRKQARDTAEMMLYKTRP